MFAMKLPAVPTQISPAKDEVLFVTNADLRESANVECWPVEAKYEALLEKATANGLADQLTKIEWRAA